MLPGLALPITFGWFSLAGEVGFVPVIFGAGGGIVSTVNDLDAGALTFPAASSAFTRKECGPSASAACGVYGDEHRLYCLASIRHRKVEPASLETKRNG